MTLKELKQWKCRAEKCVEIYKNNGKDTSTAKVTIPVNKFLDLTDTAIKALEQQPCEDCISRQATVERLCKVADFMNEKRNGLGSPYIMAALFIQDNKDEFPSVTPKEKTGKWITKPHIYGIAFCSECDFELRVNDTKYCPNCGARMVSE